MKFQSQTCRSDLFPKFLTYTEIGGSFRKKYACSRITLIAEYACWFFNHISSGSILHGLWNEHPRFRPISRNLAQNLSKVRIFRLFFWRKSDFIHKYISEYFDRNWNQSPKCEIIHFSMFRSSKGRLSCSLATFSGNGTLPSFGSETWSISHKAQIRPKYFEFQRYWHGLWLISKHPRTQNWKERSPAAIFPWMRTLSDDSIFAVSDCHFDIQMSWRSPAGSYSLGSWICARNAAGVLLDIPRMGLALVMLSGLLNLLPAFMPAPGLGLRTTAGIWIDLVVLRRVRCEINRSSIDSPYCTR